MAHDDRWNANLSRQLLQGHVQNIIDTYHNATPELLKGGNEWYFRAHDVANQVGGGDPVKGAGIIAALSPRVNWDRNIHLAHQLVQTGRASALGSNVVKARRIHEGEHPLDVLGGHKVTSFYKNIADPTDRDPVTIDTHAVNLAVGNSYVGPGGGQKHSDADKVFGSYGRYKHFEHAYKTAAGQLGVELPHQVQAVTWVTHRGGVNQ